MTARLIYADSESCADQFYATGLFAPDPFLFYQEPGGTRHLVTSALEIDRARRVARVDHVHDWADITQAWKATRPEEPDPPFEALLAHFLAEHGGRGVPIQVPEGFPLGLADRLRGAGVALEPVTGAFWPQRQHKRPEEVAAIEHALEITGRGLLAGVALIRGSRIGDDGMLYAGEQPLTSERVRGEINAALVREGAIPHHTIVAGGEQAADPHEEGHGHLPAHRAIIIDVFPRVEASGYFGDMTRTVCRGEPPERLARAWEAVRQGQEAAFAMIRHGASGQAVHAAVAECLEAAGFPTGPTPEGRQGGFFHGTGHGLGLEIHESPRISRKDQTLERGHVVTVEPGLYYPDMGGVRLEDVVVVTEEGCRNLTRVPKFFRV